MGDYVDDRGVGRNMTAGELMRMGEQRNQAAKPADLHEQDLVSVPWIRCVGHDASGNPDLRGVLEALLPDGRARVYVFPYSDDFEGGDVELPLSEVSLVERLDDDGHVVWCAHG